MSTERIILLGGAAEFQDAIQGSALGDAIEFTSSGSGVVARNKGQPVGRLTNRHELAQALAAGAKVLHASVNCVTLPTSASPAQGLRVRVVTGSLSETFRLPGARHLSLAVVGAAHPNRRGPTRRFEIAISKPGEPVTLEREPKNPADENAVRVLSERGVQIGYLTAERAPWIGGMLLKGREVRAVFQRATDWGCWIRVAFDGERPSIDGMGLPGERGGQTDWWPDEEWPNE